MTSALNALRNREISANKAAKLYKIPSSVSLKWPIIVRVIYMSLSFTSCDFLILNFSDIVQDCPQRKDWTGATFQCSGNFMETGRFGIGFGSHQEWYTSSKGSRRIRNTKVVLSTHVCSKAQKSNKEYIPPLPPIQPNICLLVVHFMAVARRLGLSCRRTRLSIGRRMLWRRLCHPIKPGAWASIRQLFITTCHTHHFMGESTGIQQALFLDVFLQ